MAANQPALAKKLRRLGCASSAGWCTRNAVDGRNVECVGFKLSPRCEPRLLCSDRCAFVNGASPF